MFIVQLVHVDITEFSVN